jgi:hypothetical protein
MNDLDLRTNAAADPEFVRFAEQQLLGYDEAALAAAAPSHAAAFHSLRVVTAMDRVRVQHRRLHAATPQERLVLLTTWAMGPLSVSEIGLHVGLSKSSSSQIVDRLVTRGMLRREEDPADRRRTLVNIGEAGMIGDTASLGVEVAGSVVDALEALDAEERLSIVCLLRAVFDGLDRAASVMEALDDEDLRQLHERIKERQERLLQTSG